MTDGSDEVSGDLLVIRDDGEKHQVTLTGVCTPEPDGGVRVEGVIRDLGRPAPSASSWRRARGGQSRVRGAPRQLQDISQLADLSVTDHLTGARIGASS